MNQNQALIVRISPEILRVTKTSPLSKKDSTMDLPITAGQWTDFMRGVLVQNALPDLSNAEREFVLTGHTQEDWDKLFPPGEED